jgi:hypothetical protein
MLSFFAGGTRRSRRAGGTLRSGVAFLAGVAGWTSRSRRTDVARSAITAGGSGRAGGPRMTGRAGGTWVNRDFQDVVQSQTNVLVNRSARLNGAHGGNGDRRRSAYSDNLFRNKFSCAFVSAGLPSHSPCLLNKSAPNGALS